MRFEILPGLPPYGPRPISFTQYGPEHREGLVVRFYPKQAEPWVGNFPPGETTCTDVLEHPNKSDVIVVAGGHACVVDPETRIFRDWIATNIVELVGRISVA